ncbi:MAG: NAD+ synthase [Thermoleophilaceae bacterium]|nr:NAD+ synthase [Thermoleophilaceae bacterium]
MDPLRVALAQFNAVVGDLSGNAAGIVEWSGRARSQGASLIVFPELALSGYPPEDLVLKTDFLAAVDRQLTELAASISGIAVLVGFPERRGELLANSAALIRAGQVETVYRKHRLPNYGVFDERRYFTPGTDPLVFEIDGHQVGVTICEDEWFPGGPGQQAAQAGADLIVNLSASPFHAGKGLLREQEVLAARASEYGAPVLLCNLVGGQDELVFDGASLGADPDGSIVVRGPQFEEELMVVEIAEGRLHGPLHDALEPDAETYGALVLGLTDYVAKNGFNGVLIALSGGIDSALVALVAVDALGPERVRFVTMPSRHSSDGTRSDAHTIAANLGVAIDELAIEDAFVAFETTLAAQFAGREPDATEENLQARIRGTLMMALSNKFGQLVLTTGNKSEMSVGYATLYGDMAGGFALIKDVFKGDVYRLVIDRNRRAGRPLIPTSVIDRAPSAELRPDQTDQDSLPDYDVLDAILEGYVERDLGFDGLVAKGFPPEVVEHVIRLVDLAEYKRRQAPPGIRISTKAFGRDRRMPITNRFRGTR